MSDSKGKILDDAEHAALMVARAWSSDQLKSQQAEIKRAVTVMEKQLSAFSSVVSDSEVDSIREAVATFRRLAAITEHAKEKKRRIEKFCEEVAKKAFVELKAAAEKMPLEPRLVLATADQFSLSSPLRYRLYEEILKEDGFVFLQNRLKADLDHWCGSSGKYIAYRLRDNYPSVTDADIRHEVVGLINQSMGGFAVPEVFRLAINEAAAAASFINKVKLNLVDSR